MAKKAPEQTTTQADPAAEEAARLAAEQAEAERLAAEAEAEAARQAAAPKPYRVMWDMKLGGTRVPEGETLRLTDAQLAELGLVASGVLQPIAE